MSIRDAVAPAPTVRLLSPNAPLPDTGERLPAVVWPTLALFAGAAALAVLSVYAGLSGAMPLWWCIPVNAVVAFVMFTVLHDASHHAIGRSDALNDWVGRISLLFVTGHGSFSFFRFIHIEHHRNTNESIHVDPDAWCHGAAWTYPLRWASIDVWYTIFWLRRLRERPRAEVIETFAMSGLYAALLTWATLAGQLWPVLCLVLLPQRLAVFVLAWSFDWLPHHGLRDTARSNRYQATRNRIGREWLLNPLMLWQNYHLIHHLHPSIPFFTYRRVWLRNEAHYLAQEPPLTTAFGRALTPAAYRRARGLPPPAVAGSGRRLEFHALRVADLQRLTDDSVAIRFAVPDALRETFRFEAGQHLTLRAVIDGMSCRRSYSICSPAPDGALRVAVRRVPDGIFSGYALERLRVGDRLDVMPPSGQFRTALDASRARTHVAIAAGSGITPILSLAMTTLAAEPRSRFVLIYGNRSAASTMFRDELRELQQQYPQRFELLHCLSQPAADDSAGLLGGEIHRGRIEPAALAALLGARVALPAVDAWFLCGPQALVEQTRDWLGQNGVDARRVHIELFAAATRAPAPVEAGTPAPTSAVQVRAGGRSTAFEMAQRGETVLDAAMRLRPDLPYSCLGGACGTCRARLCSGSVEMEQNFALDADALAAGYVLTCQSRPSSAQVVLDYDA